MTAQFFGGLPNLSPRQVSRGPVLEEASVLFPGDIDQHPKTMLQRIIQEPNRRKVIQPNTVPAHLPDL